MGGGGEGENLRNYCWRRRRSSRSGGSSKTTSNSSYRSSSSLRSRSCSFWWRQGRTLLLMVVCLLLAGGSEGSELPDRECCDSVPPPPQNYHRSTSTTTTTTTPPPKEEFNTSIATSHTTGGTMNCMEARQQCLNDRECQDVYKMLNKVCGPELVACSSTTPNKCQMLLRTLRNFDYLVTCKCSEAHLDFTCHSFREMIFSHPCGLVETDDYSDYSPPLMPNCIDAYNKCKAKGSCLRDYVEFVNVCSFIGITCTAQDSDKCMASWSKIRHSPLFGCVCTPPSPMRALAYGSDLGAASISSTSLTSYSTIRKVGSQQETCVETFNRTHENPCLEIPSPPLRVDFISPLYRPLDFFYRPLDLSSVLGYPVPNRDDVSTFFPMAPWGHILWDGPNAYAPQSLDGRDEVGQHDVTKAKLVDASQATCHSALEKCQNDEKCRPLLDDVMIWCEHAHCEPDRCRTALQEFYDRVSIIHRLQVAFCVCSNRQSDPDGECLTAMRKLHPTCAERHSGRDPMKCHKIAEQCRKSPVCREKLREYEQKCAADAMTGRCADTHRSCQKAVMNILGTELHATCVCKGTDFLHQHNCYTWQKLLWSNPCVIESHLMLHKEIAEGSSDDLDEVFRRPQVVTTPQPRVPYVNPTPEEDDELARPAGSYGVFREMSPDGSAPRQTGTSYGRELTVSWETHRRPGVSMGRDRDGGMGGIGIGRNGGSRGGGGGGGGGMVIGGGGRNGGLSVGRGGIPGEPDIGREVDRGRGPVLGRENGGRGVYTGVLSPGVNFKQTQWSGRNRGNGLSISRNGGRNGGRFGGSQPDSSNGGGRGGSWVAPRVPDMGMGGGRDPMGGAGNPYEPDSPDTGYGGRGRGSIGTGHRGTAIPISNSDRGSGSSPGGRDWGRLSGANIGRPSGSWRGGHEYPDLGGRGPDDRGFPSTRSPPRHGHFERVTRPPLGGATPTPPAIAIPTSMLTTTTEIPTTTMPRRTCSIKNVKNEKMMNLEIPEGSRRRIYNSSDCSELCECRAQNRVSKPEAICTTLRCIENKACNTESAKFPHSAPYYRAYRGVCDCYAGNFICQKPDPAEYSLGPGVYMFLGYSKGEMEILKPVTSKNELDALQQMEQTLVRKYGFKCSLEVKNHIGENVIAIANLNVSQDVYMNSYVRQQKEKDDCAGPLQELAQKINARPRHSDILTDAHLSMFILAEVDVNYPAAQTSSSSSSSSSSVASIHLRPDVALAIPVAMLTHLLLLPFLLHHLLLLHRSYPVEGMMTVAPSGIRAT